MRKRILITGGTGFLGIHCARYFLKKGFDVTLLDIAPLTSTDLKGKVTVVGCDIKDEKNLERYFKNIDYVVHAAAALPIQYSKSIIFDTNVLGTKNVLEASFKNKVKRVVFISTTAVYGIPKHLPEKETAPLDPMGNYGKSKAEAEKVCLSYYKKGLSINIIRPKTFLGPERLGVFSLWFEAIYNNKPVFILGNGHNLYQLLAVEDLCILIDLTLTTKIDGEIFNAGAKKFGTWRQDLTSLIKHARSKSKIISIPTRPTQDLLFILEKLRLSPIVEWHYRTMPVNSYVSSEKAEVKLGWKPKKSNVDIYIDSYDWYKKNRKDFINQTGTTHRTIWNFKLLNLITRFL